MKFFKNIFIIVILFSMNIYARPPWDQGPNNRTYRATANIYVEDVNGNPVFNISGTFHFKMSFDTDGDGCVDEDDPLAYKFETGNFTTDQQGSAFVELFITVPIEWYNGWKNVYVNDLNGQINGVNISISECNNTQS
ncbi:MAG: hypothetical protein U9R41_06245, partial [Candidatus Marinimicrobia bacterium]|nr:hypothetical protein [Candidatus Neomarinimicrobiota bacterium]